MYHSGFDYAVGCGGENRTDEDAIIEFNYSQCIISRVGEVTLGVFGVVGCIIHSYIIFCYNFRPSEQQRAPVETLIISLSCYDLFYCAGLVVLAVLSRIPSYVPDIACPLQAIVLSFYRNSLFLVVLLLACNRYYAVCRPQYYGRYFSKLKIKIYAISSFAVSFVIALINQTNACFLHEESDDYSTYYHCASAFCYVIFYLPMIILTTMLYVKIYKKQKEIINTEEFYNEYCAGALTEDIESERRFLGAITISTIITVSILIGDFVINFLVSLFSIDPMLFNSDGKSVDNISFILSAVIASLISMLFVVNPCIFMATNDQFKIKLTRPIRELKKRMRAESQLKIVELNTETQALSEIN